MSEPVDLDPDVAGLNHTLHLLATHAYGTHRTALTTLARTPRAYRPVEATDHRAGDLRGVRGPRPEPEP